ncbi:MAG: nitrous oxide reductase family maturation protein NosD [Gammaproteobacteria bacterium]|nr:nitrous oxide reductase family maturation protein NosD [Gammaproteobacteria bacterium]
MKYLAHLPSILLGLLINVSAYALPPLQLYVELTPEGGVLRPPAGRYAGPVVITRPITIEGRGEVILDGEGSDTVLAIQANGTTIRGLQITGSGDSFDKVDAGIVIEADNSLVENNRLEDVLFGIHLRGANNNIVRGNYISSKSIKPSLRGEGLRLWNSYDNVIENNDVVAVRDNFITNSSNNRLQGNRISDSRIGIQLVFAHENEIINNSINNNRTGILLFYSNDLLIQENKIFHLRSFSGAALAFKESSGVLVKDNEILHCAVGITANAPVHPENILTLENNRFAYNDVALYFYGEKGGHIVRKNRFEQNLTDVRVSAPSTALANAWQENYWDTYQGFDLNHDGTGDTPHEQYLYSDRIWMDRPMTQFFRGSPLMEFIDFVERLTSFSEPKMVLRDPAPKFQ